MLDDSDAELAELARSEVEELEAERLVLDGQLAELLRPRDPNDDKNVVLEIRAGTGWWLDLLAQKHISANVTETYPFDQIGTALARLLGRQARGKIVLDMS